MAEKYIELIEPISESEEIGSSVHYGVKLALAWLDDHPDQAPGRTIAESEFDELVDALHQNWATPEYFSGVLSDALIDLGIKVIPDPEPTNADKLNELICQATGSASASLLAGYLDEAGVRAPGGDDD